MKANEAPKKIYVNFHFTETHPGSSPLVTKQGVNKYDIEYTRTDAFIDKAATWIANRYQANGSYLCADDIEDFRKYMKGE